MLWVEGKKGLVLWMEGEEVQLRKEELLSVLSVCREREALQATSLPEKECNFSKESGLIGVS